MVYSTEDPAGMNISSNLLCELPFKEMPLGSFVTHSYNDFYLLSAQSSLINLSLSLLGAEWILCLSKHRSESGIRCLTVHTPGNLGDRAEFGGRPKEVAISNPPLQRSLLKELQRSASDLNLNVPISIEATHHGPTSLSIPVTFIEIGSDELAWRDELMGKAVAKAVSRTLNSTFKAESCAIGIGGGHYSEKFTHLILTDDALIGHIIPKYAMQEGMDPSMIKACIDRTLGGCSKAYVDWKGTPSKYKEIIKSIENIELLKV